MKKLTLLFFLLSSIHLFACDCPPLETLSKELCKKYDMIADVHADSVSACSADGSATVYFTILNLYKGSTEQHIAVRYDCRSSCMMSFAAGEEWIVYATYKSFNKLDVNMCSPSRKKITDGSADYYEVASQRSFEQEIDWLKTNLGIQAFAQHNELNDQEKEMAPHNDQPSGTGKLVLLLVSLVAMLLVYFVSKKFFRNGK